MEKFVAQSMNKDKTDLIFHNKDTEGLFLNTVGFSFG